MTVNNVVHVIIKKLSDFNCFFFRILAIIVFNASFIFLFYSLIPLHIFIGFMLLAGSGFLLLKFKWNDIVKQGILRKLPIKLQTLLLQRSLLDIWSDIVYFPTFSKIIAAFIRSIVVKPSPQKLHQQFSDLSQNFQNMLKTKGLLHLAPSKIEKMFIEKLQIPFQLPQNYGKISTQWYNKQQYNKNPIKVHEVSMTQNVFYKVQQLIKWYHIVFLSLILSLGVKKMKMKRMSKMMVNNGVFVGIIILCVMILIKIKTSKRNNNIVLLQLDVQNDN